MFAFLLGFAVGIYRNEFVAFVSKFVPQSVKDWWKQITK